jgi:hypothetical protein
MCRKGFKWNIFTLMLKMSQVLIIANTYAKDNSPYGFHQPDIPTHDIAAALRPTGLETLTVTHRSNGFRPGSHYLNEDGLNGAEILVAGSDIDAQGLAQVIPNLAALVTTDPNYAEIPQIDLGTRKVGVYYIPDADEVAGRVLSIAKDYYTNRLLKVLTAFQQARQKDNT